MSETLDTRSPHKSQHEDVINPVHEQKILLPEDKTNIEDQKRMKASCETVIILDVVECDSNILQLQVV